MRVGRTCERSFFYFFACILVFQLSLASKQHLHLRCKADGSMYNGFMHASKLGPVTGMLTYGKQITFYIVRPGQELKPHSSLK